MKFRRVPLADARGHILGHNVSHDGRRVLKKGRRLGEAELEELARAAQEHVYVAALEPGDVDEDAAALRIGEALARAGGLTLKLAHGGRVSLLAPGHGVLSLDAARLLELNLLDGVTLATAPAHSVTRHGQLIATLKVVPFALPEASVRRAEELCSAGLLAWRPLEPRRIAILVSGAQSRRERLFDAYRGSLTERLERLGQRETSAEYIPLGADPERELALAVAARLDAGVDLLILVGETATMDADDLTPLAIARAGGHIDVVGAPVFPGNLLLLGHRGAAAILGAPGCVRSPQSNIVDLLLPRLLVGQRLGPRDIAELGQGGLLVDTVHELPPAGAAARVHDDG